eukprot:UN01878
MASHLIPPNVNEKLDTPDTAQLDKVNRGDEKWMRDTETDNCKRCDVEFKTVQRRKHHCRMCGFIVCDNCSRNRVQLKKNGRKSRVCNECFNQIAPRHMRSYSARTPSGPIIKDKENNQIVYQSTISENLDINQIVIQENTDIDDDIITFEKNENNTTEEKISNAENGSNIGDTYPFESPTQPLLLNNQETRCCACNIL